MSDGLDFAALTDDQILALLQALMGEAAARNPATARAAEDAVLGKAEQVRILRAAGTSEFRAMRAVEREQLAREARAAVQARLAGTSVLDPAERGAIEAAAEAEVRTRLAAEEAASARAAAAERVAVERRRQEAQAREAERRTWLERAAALVQQPGDAIHIVHVATGYGRRVLINAGDDRYARAHLADYTCADGRVSTNKALVKFKPGLAALCAEFAAAHPPGTVLYGSQLTW